MILHLVTLFPAYFRGPLEAGLLGKAGEQGIARVEVHDLRQWTHDRHGTADDYPFGGGPGMVLKPEPFFEALDALQEQGLPGTAPVILTTPQGRRFDQSEARKLADQEQMVILCGRYRGVDERVRLGPVTHEYSVGDVVLNGGEAAALVMIEAVVRLLPGVVGDPASAAADSFACGLLDHPHYTRPAEYRGRRVPEVLVSGHHARIEQWRRRQQLLRTMERRPDLLTTAALTDEDRQFLEQVNTQQRTRRPRPASSGGEDLANGDL